MKTVSHIQRHPNRHWVGDGFPVRSIFSYHDNPAAFSPFLLLDYAGPTRFDPTPKRRGVGPHPHRGFETVSIVYHGEVSHRDSTGAGGTIGPGDVQWMTAAAGIVHEEFHSEHYGRTGGPFEMVQLWVNLPQRDKMAAPGYQGITAAQTPTVDWLDIQGQSAGTARLIAGELGTAKGPARTFTPMQVWDLRLQAGHTVTLPAAAGHTALALVLNGRLQALTRAAAGPAHPPEAAPPVLEPPAEWLAEGAELIVFGRAGEGVLLRALADATVLWLSGAPIDEPVVGYGPFVMNSEAQIDQALADFRSGRMGRIDATASG